MLPLTARRALCLITLATAVLITACGPQSGATPTPTRTAAPPGTAGTPTAAQPATPTPPPAATATLPPDAPADGGVMTSFPPDVNPLTGEQVADPAVLDRRPLAIKISNSPMEYVRPQSGIGAADLVFEHYAEGGVTRLTAVYLSRDAQVIGPVRSGRLIDLEVPVMYRAMFVCSGYSSGVKALVRASDLYAENRIISQDFGAGEPPFERIDRGPDVPLEHTLYTSTGAMWAETGTRGLDGRQELKGMAFAATPSAGGVPVTTLQVNYAAAEARVEWRYDGAAGRWLRSEGGVAFTDALDGRQVSAANVVVLYANHVQTDIQEDSLGSMSIQIQLWGTGPAGIYRDGLYFDGFWIRQQPGDMLGFTDSAGKLIPFKPGNTWFQVVTLDAGTETNGETAVVTP